MKTISCLIAIGLALFIMSVPPAQSQEDYTFIANARGNQVCFGRWVPGSAIGEAGVCEGEMVGIPQLTAISAKQSVDRLDQMLAVLVSIDQKLDISNDQMEQLIEAAKSPRQSAQNNERLHQAISQRFDALPKGLLVNRFVADELTRLKEDILTEVDQHYPVKQTPSPK